MDLVWVLLIWIRPLFLFSCFPVLWFLLIVFLFAILYIFFFVLLFFLHCFALFFLCVSFSFLFERRRGHRHLEGGTCDRVTCPTTM